MSRSYKKTPVCKDGNASKKRGKKIANKKIRKMADLGQKSNLYKKDMNLGTFAITDFMKNALMGTVLKT